MDKRETDSNSSDVHKDLLEFLNTPNYDRLPDFFPQSNLIDFGCEKYFRAFIREMLRKQGLQAKWPEVDPRDEGAMKMALVQDINTILKEDPDLNPPLPKQPGRGKKHHRQGSSKRKQSDSACSMNHKAEPETPPVSPSLRKVNFKQPELLQKGPHQGNDSHFLHRRSKPPQKIDLSCPLKIVSGETADHYNIFQIPVHEKDQFSGRESKRLSSKDNEKDCDHKKGSPRKGQKKDRQSSDNICEQSSDVTIAVSASTSAQTFARGVDSSEYIRILDTADSEHTPLRGMSYKPYDTFGSAYKVSASYPPKIDYFPVKRPYHIRYPNYTDTDEYLYEEDTPTPVHSSASLCEDEHKSFKKHSKNTSLDTPYQLPERHRPTWNPNPPQANHVKGATQRDSISLLNNPPAPDRSLARCPDQEHSATLDWVLAHDFSSGNMTRAALHSSTNLHPGNLLLSDFEQGSLPSPAPSSTDTLKNDSKEYLSNERPSKKHTSINGMSIDKREQDTASTFKESSGHDQNEGFKLQSLFLPLNHPQRALWNDTHYQTSSYQQNSAPYLQFSHEQDGDYQSSLYPDITSTSCDATDCSRSHHQDNVLQPERCPIQPAEKDQGYVVASEMVVDSALNTPKNLKVGYHLTQSDDEDRDVVRSREDNHEKCPTGTTVADLAEMMRIENLDEAVIDGWTYVYMTSEQHKQGTLLRYKNFNEPVLFDPANVPGHGNAKNSKVIKKNKSHGGTKQHGGYSSHRDPIYKKCTSSSYRQRQNSAQTSGPPKREPSSGRHSPIYQVVIFQEDPCHRQDPLYNNNFGSRSKRDGQCWKSVTTSPSSSSCSKQVSRDDRDDPARDTAANIDFSDLHSSSPTHDPNKHEEPHYFRHPPRCQLSEFELPMIRLGDLKHRLDPVYKKAQGRDLADIDRTPTSKTASRDTTYHWNSREFPQHRDHIGGIDYRGVTARYGPQWGHQLEIIRPTFKRAFVCEAKHFTETLIHPCSSDMEIELLKHRPSKLSISTLSRIRRFIQSCLKLLKGSHPVESAVAETTKKKKLLDKLMGTIFTSREDLSGPLEENGTIV